MSYQYNTSLKLNARDLRKNQTDVEKLLWSKLRNRQLMNLKFRRQFPIGKYILDFYCSEKKLVIELDGGQHNTDRQRIRDEERDKTLAQMKIVVLRAWNNEVIENMEGVVEKILMHARK